MAEATEVIDDVTRFDVAVDEYLSHHYDGERCRKVLEAGGWDAGLNAELAGLGWFALAVPEESDGLGAPLAVLGPVFMELGRHLAAGPLLENLLLPAILTTARRGTPPQVASAVVTGVPLALVDPGITEHWTRDLGGVTLRDGRLTGRVEAVRFARQAELLVVIADGGTGPVLRLVAADAPGVRVEEVPSADPATTFARVSFEDVATEPGPVGDDTELVLRIRAWARLLLACELSGLARRSLELTVQYLGQREQFGRLIGGFQAVKHIAADMQATWAGLHHLCLATLEDAGHASTAELELLGMTVKAHAASAAVRVCEDAIQLHGGIGFTAESDVSWLYRRALALRAWYGDETELQDRIGAVLLDPDENHERRP